jgi:ATP-dependent helicase/nuclease subunit B
MAETENTLHPKHDLNRLARQTAQWIAARAVPACDVVVLVPYAQLMAPSRQAWQRTQGGGFVPRFLSTEQWSAELAHWQAPITNPWNWSTDAGCNHWLAMRLIEQSGMLRALGAAAHSSCADQLMQAAKALVPKAQAMDPAQRVQWLDSARAAQVFDFEGVANSVNVQGVEVAILRLALEWVGGSNFATDVLWDERVRASTTAVLVWQGLQTQTLAQALVAHWGEQSGVLTWPTDSGAASEFAPEAPSMTHLCVHAANDLEHEAQLASALVLAQLQAGHHHVAVAALDRALSRRLRVELALHGVPVQDETGWKLSTTHAAAQVMSVLGALAYRASIPEVLQALRQLPCVGAAQWAEIEKALASVKTSQWPGLDFWSTERVSAECAHSMAQWQAWCEAWRAKRSLGQWLSSLQQLLTDSGLWALLHPDAAGQALLKTLSLDPTPAAWVQAQTQAVSLGEFSSWVRGALEAASFVPTAQESGGSSNAQVNLIPLAQVLGREWDALVLPACDDLHLPWCPPDSSPWTARQRQALGLPSAAERSAMQQALWAQVCRHPQVQVLYRQSEQGQALLASPLLRLGLLAAGGASLKQMAQTQTEPRLWRSVQSTPQAAPTPQASALPLTRLSPSAYEDLRKCPYRFYARQVLGLRQQDEWGEELERRDWGNWLHAVLRRFHEQRSSAMPDAQQLQDCADQLRREHGFDAAPFLPFEASWQAVKNAYLTWLHEYEAQGGRFVKAEWALSCEPVSVPIKLVGRLDRFDQTGSHAQVWDYKTESIQTSKARVKTPMEDTQLAFYAVLVQHALADPPEHVRAAYLNISDRGEVNAVELPDLAQEQEALLLGIAQDMAAIAAGHALPALGEGKVCDTCDARGLCRKDFWGQA